MNEWHPANSVISGYTRKNYKAPLTITGGSRNKIFENAVNSNRSTFTRHIISIGGYGSITRLSDPRFALKTMNFDSRLADDVKIFLNEIRVGSLPGIQKVGPKIYAFKIMTDSSGKMTTGKYIMDNLENTPFKFDTMANLYQFETCPTPEFFKKLKKTIEDFWRITGGFHGDLHDSNIGVIHDDKDIKKIVILDYGSHKKFKNSFSNSSCFDDFVKMIDKQFYNKYVKSTRGYYPETSKIKVIYAKRGQPFRANTNMLRGLNFHGKPIINKFSNSIMSKIIPMNNNSIIKNYIARKRYMTEGRLTNNNIRKHPGTHRNLFMSPRVFNKLKPVNHLSILKNEFSKQNINISKISNIIKKIPQNKKNQVKNFLKGVPNNKRVYATVAGYLL